MPDPELLTGSILPQDAWIAVVLKIVTASSRFYVKYGTLYIIRRGARSPYHVSRHGSRVLGGTEVSKKSIILAFQI